MRMNSLNQHFSFIFFGLKIGCSVFILWYVELNSGSRGNVYPYISREINAKSSPFVHQHHVDQRKPNLLGHSVHSTVFPKY